MTDRLMLLDTASLYFRAFHGVPDSLKAPDGTPVNAVRGLLDIIARLVTDFQPTQLVACWDDDWRPGWRVDLLPSYKAHRVAEAVPGGIDVEETPPGLVAQLPLIREVLDVLGIAVVGAPEHEADDVIGSLAAQADLPVDVVTGDRDLFQLVDDSRNVRVIYTARGMSKLETVTDATVVGKYGVLPVQYADYAVLRGDASDGLPGVSGIGEKTAAKLLQEFVDLDGIIAAAGDHTTAMGAPMRAKISAAADYLAAAPRVVNVVRDLSFGGFDASLRPLDAGRLSRMDGLKTEHNLGGSVQRVLKALGNDPQAAGS
ncbi:5'-3' exonuclease [Arthrobacter crystallopoietes BAB-32]|uniref:5'-3' exonuclease n=1 Tax=Arthrobacter crystallopoietes BAB-32 TaxID=1246476 RepID=N1UW51_9MICC|nr:5'-3' exonuclease [Arthrobacter crystallopoietes]EMY33270.1 5'-3' exonuclease [Arthrobacter crystallopoietes BAB-32]